MQVYTKPTGDWKRLAKRYRRNFLELYLSSPVITLNGNHYSEIRYFYPFDNPLHLVALNVRGVVVLRNGQTVETNLSVVRRILRSTSLLYDVMSEPFLNILEHFAVLGKRASQARTSLQDLITWFQEHQSLLCRYVSAQTYTAFLRAIQGKLDALTHRANEAAGTLRILSSLLSSPSMSAREIEAMYQLSVRTQRWNAKNTQLLVEGGRFAEQLQEELLSQRDAWAHGDLTSRKVCEKAARVWKTIAKAADKPRQRLEQTNYYEVAFEQRQNTVLQEHIDRALAVYRVPLVKPDGFTGVQEEREFTDAELDRILASLPPLPERLPWRSGRARIARIGARIGVGLGMAISLAGIVFSVWLMIIQGPSFSAISQALFFASWLFLLPQYLRRL